MFFPNRAKLIYEVQNYRAITSLDRLWFWTIIMEAQIDNIKSHNIKMSV